MDLFSLRNWSVSSTMDIINQNWSSQSEIEFGSFWNECVPRSLYMCTQQFAQCILNGHVTLLHPLTEFLDPHLNNPFKPTVSISFCVRLLWYLLNCLFKESHHGAHPAIVQHKNNRFTETLIPMVNVTFCQMILTNLLQWQFKQNKTIECSNINRSCQTWLILYWIPCLIHSSNWWTHVQALHYIPD